MSSIVEVPTLETNAGVVLGSWCATLVPDAILRVALAVTLIVAGAKLLF